MSHGDDDGLRVPPALAPQQIVILPRLKGDDSDAPILEYCDTLRKQLIGSQALGRRSAPRWTGKTRTPAPKRWDWIRRGAPLLVEIGPREVEANAVSVLRRDALYEGEKVKPGNATADEFANTAASRLEDIQTAMHGQAKTFMESRIESGITEFGALGEFFGEAPEDEDGPSEGAAALGPGALV